jgi:low affinity Fe/Cu permease
VGVRRASGVWLGCQVIGTGVVYAIQNTQNRESAAVRLKLDELIRAHQGTHNALLDLEELGEKVIVIDGQTMVMERFNVTEPAERTMRKIFS